MQNFLQTLLLPDCDDDPENFIVTHAANILQIGEFQLLQLAYHEWHGRDISPEAVDRIFAAYMIHDQAPYWSRLYARQIIDKSERGEIDIDNPRFHCYDQNYITHVPDGIRDFIITILIVLTLLFGSFLLGYLATQNSGSSVGSGFFDGPQPLGADGKTRPINIR